MPSESFFVYLQRPDTGEWVTVGRYQATAGPAGAAFGEFQYAPSYVAAGHAWSIDPVGLPFIPGKVWRAPRYRGLHDVLRDACPDSWGQAVLQREHALPEGTPPVRFLVLARNDVRWGALAVGSAKAPPATHLVAHLNSPAMRDWRCSSAQAGSTSAGKPYWPMRFASGSTIEPRPQRAWTSC